MIITEFVVPMPLTCSEYERGHLYGVCESSLRESRKGTGIEILVNEPFKDRPLFDGKYSSGQYTKKVYHVEKTVPRFIAPLAPKTSMVLYEESWNAFPYTRTVITNQKMGKDFFVKIETLLVDGDRGGLINPHQLEPDKLKKREVVIMDIARDRLPQSWSTDGHEPSERASLTTGRGPLETDWILTTKPVMTCYKLVTAHFRWFGLQRAVERYIATLQQKLCLKLHKDMFCTLDEWYGLSLPDIRRLEEQIRAELAVKLHEESRGESASGLASPSTYQLRTGARWTTSAHEIQSHDMTSKTVLSQNSQSPSMLSSVVTIGIK